MTLPNVHPKRMADEHLLPAALLETGDTLNFLEVRKHSLRVKIKDSKLSAATGKVSGLSAALGGGLLYFTLANPLGALLACGGLAAYGLAVGAQWLQTGKLHPFPLTSKTADESDEELSASTLTGGSLQIARSHIHEEASYLEPREKAEYELLHHAPQGLLNAVGSVAPAQRWACYCFLLDAHLTGTLDDYRDRATLETVLGNASVYHSHLPEAAERFPEIGLDSATAQPPSLSAANDALPTATSSPIGNTTKFGAIEVPVSQSGPPTQNEMTAPTALSALLRSPFLSRALFGAQRTGKSYLAAVASCKLAQTGTNIFHVNLMSYGSEDAEYWQHAKKSIRCDLPALSVSEGKPFIKQAISLVAEFVQTPNSLLIVDEWAYMASTANPHRDSLGGLLNDISSQITSLSSAGIKRQRGLWAISPEFVAGSLVPQGKAVKKLQLVYVTIHPDRWVDWNGNAIGFSDELFQQVANNFPIDLPDSMELPDHDRIVYIDRQWLPVGELPTLDKPPVASPREREVSKSENKQDQQDKKRETLEKLYQETPNLPTATALELIQSVPDDAKREALLTAYKWATTRLEDGKDIDKQSFLARARSERNCAYLRDHREEIWDELQGLVD
jgi:hypothetical protein